MMRYSSSRLAGSREPMNTPYRQFGAGADHGRHPYDHDRDHDRDRDHHRHHRMIYWNGGIYPYPYFYSGYPIYAGTINPWLFGPDDYDQDQSAANYGSAGNYDPAGNDASDQTDGEDESGDPQYPYAPDPNYAGQYGMQQPASPQYAPQAQSGAQSQPPAARQPSAARQPYTGNAPSTRPNTAQEQPQRSSAGLSSPAVTVIFKDGRPEEHIHDYLLTGDTLTVFEPHYRQIPLDQVNLAATQAANQAAGVDFRVPRQ
jgi:hypothetical protein